MILWWNSDSPLSNPVSSHQNIDSHQISENGWCSLEQYHYLNYTGIQLKDDTFRQLFSPWHQCIWPEYQEYTRLIVISETWNHYAHHYLIYNDPNGTLEPFHKYLYLSYIFFHWHKLWRKEGISQKNRWLVFTIFMGSFVLGFLIRRTSLCSIACFFRIFSFLCALTKKLCKYLLWLLWGLCWHFVISFSWWSIHWS